MAIEIFWFSGSGYAWRAVLAAELKKVPYESRLIQASQGDHRSPEFLAMNPRGKVPVLRDGDLVVSESMAILAYLDRLYPEPPFFGATAAETAQIWRIVLDFDHYAQPAFTDLLLPIFFDQVDAKRDQVDAAAEQVREELATMESRLAGRSWLVGDALSAADVAIYPFIEGTLRAAGKPAAQPLDLGLLPFERTHPAIEAWRRRIMALPGYDAAYPPHWKETA